MKKTMIAILFLASLFVGNAAFAGSVSNVQVYVYSSSSYSRASGAIPAARFSNDSTQYIQCSLNGTGSRTNVFCNARDRNGQYVSCSSTNATHIEALGAMTESSYLYFNKNGTGSSTCSTVKVYNSSFHLPAYDLD